jgi:ankyrin repeat protein
MYVIRVHCTWLLHCILTRLAFRKGCTPLHLAAQDGSDSIIEALLDTKTTEVCCDRERERETWHLLGRCDTLVVRWLVQINLQSKDGSTALLLYTRLALDDCWQERKKILDKFVACGADVNLGNIVGYTPLHQAATRQQEHLLRWLLNKGANPNLANRYCL